MLKSLQILEKCPESGNFSPRTIQARQPVYTGLIPSETASVKAVPYQNAAKTFSGAPKSTLRRLGWGRCVVGRQVVKKIAKIEKCFKVFEF